MYILLFDVYHPHPLLEVFEIHTDIIHIHILIMGYNYIWCGLCEENYIIMKTSRIIRILPELISLHVYYYIPCLQAFECIYVL